MDKALQEGVRPDRIGFVAFTRKAANEAIERARDRFMLSEKQLPHFRTLHSMAFRMLGLSKNHVMNYKKYQEFGDIMGLRISGKINSEDGTIYGNSKGDKALFLSSLARLKCVSLEKQWKSNTNDLGWYEIERVHNGLKKFKLAHGLFDFTDMLERFVGDGGAPSLDLLVIDEAQDLSQLQWRMVEKLAASAKKVIVAGDDDQAIFQWAGADINYFINLKGKVNTLNKSYRTPQKIQNFALNIIKEVKTRREKQWASKEEEGGINYHTTTENINMDKGSWLVLARNAFFLDPVEEQCRREGLIYERRQRRSVDQTTLDTIMAWEKLRKGGECNAKEAKNIIWNIKGKMAKIPKEGCFTLEFLKDNFEILTTAIWHEAFDKMSLVERSYMIAALRKGEKITKTPRINLSTIHGAKGGEADNVILFTDMAHRTYQDMIKMPDAEKRVFYVGATRTRKNLHIIVPNTKFFFYPI